MRLGAQPLWVLYVLDDVYRNRFIKGARWQRDIFDTCSYRLIVPHAVGCQEYLGLIQAVGVDIDPNHRSVMTFVDYGLRAKTTP
jgi:hypothetical protein